MKKVMIFGTFDIFHEGHKSLIRQAKEFGNHLIVVVGRGETVLKVKKYTPKNNEKKRVRVIEESGLADEVILGSLGDKYEIIEKYHPDVICLGYDQEFFVDDLRNELKKRGMGNVRIERMKSYKPGKYKTSKLRKN